MNTPALHGKVLVIDPDQLNAIVTTAIRDAFSREALPAIRALADDFARQRATKDAYRVGEFAKLVQKSSYTIREHCRAGRIRATKLSGGRGRHQDWSISHAELTRYRNQGLLPQPKANGS